MSDFTVTDFGFVSMSSKELDVAGTTGATLGSVAYGYSLPTKAVMVRHGWRLTVVATGGMGNCGVGILTPASARTRAIHLAAYTDRWSDQLGCAPSELYNFYDVVKSTRFGWEVLGWVIANPSTDVWVSYPGQGRGVNNWREASASRKDLLDGFSVPRLDAMHTLVQSLESCLVEKYLA